MAKKKVVSSIKNKASISPVASRSKMAATKSSEPLLFGKTNYILMLVGSLLMAIGFILMLGGEMPDANTWDEDLIYGFQRTVLAPFMILAGLITLVFSIFKKQAIVVDHSSSSEERVVNKNM